MFKNIFTINLLNYYIDIFFYVKVKLYELYELIFIENNFVLNDVELYINISKKYNVKYYFNNCINSKIINKIDDKLIYSIYNYYNIPFINNEDIRLKLNFNYNNNNYILYYPLHKQIFKDFASEKYYIPYPPYTEDIISKYRKSIVEPIYNISTKKSIIYSLFMIDSKNLHKIELNRKHTHNNDNSHIIYENDNYYRELINNKLLKYFNKIKTPFNDFGLLYNCPVKVKWIFAENKIKIDNYESLFIKFLNIYLDENNFELKEHIIDIANIENYVISERMKSELFIKNQEIINELNKNF